MVSDRNEPHKGARRAWSWLLQVHGCPTSFCKDRLRFQGQAGGTGRAQCQVLIFGHNFVSTLKSKSWRHQKNCYGQVGTGWHVLSADTTWRMRQGWHQDERSTPQWRTVQLFQSKLLFRNFFISFFNSISIFSLDMSICLIFQVCWLPHTNSPKLNGQALGSIFKGKFDPKLGSAGESEWIKSHKLIGLGNA